MALPSLGESFSNFVFHVYSRWQPKNKRWYVRYPTRTQFAQITRKFIPTVVRTLMRQPIRLVNFRDVKQLTVFKTSAFSSHICRCVTGFTMKLKHICKFCRRPWIQCLIKGNTIALNNELLFSNWPSNHVNRGKSLNCGHSPAGSALFRSWTAGALPFCGWSVYWILRLSPHKR